MLPWRMMADAFSKIHKKTNDLKLCQFYLSMLVLRAQLGKEFRKCTESKTFSLGSFGAVLVLFHIFYWRIVAGSFTYLQLFSFAGHFHAPILRLSDFRFFLPQNLDLAENFDGKQSVIFGATGSGWKPCRSIQALMARRSLRFFSLASGVSCVVEVFSVVCETAGKLNWEVVLTDSVAFILTLVL